MQEDEGKGIIRIDGLVRRNVGVSLGDKIEVRKAEVLPAERITIAPIISEGHKISFGQGIENFVKRGLLKRPLNKGDVVIVPGIALMGGALPFMVISTAPKGVVQIQDDTIIEMKEEPVREGEVLTPTVTYEDIGGLKEELMKVREMIELPLKHAELFERLVIDPPNRDEAIDPALRRPGRFDREIEIGVPDRNGRKEILQIHTRGMPIEGAEEERDHLLSELADVCHGFVGADLAALAREAAMKALRRYLPDIDLDKPVPAETLEKMRVLADDFRSDRREILKIHPRGMPIEGAEEDRAPLPPELGDFCHGFVGAALAAPPREAAMKALRRYLPDIDLDKPIPAETLEKMRVLADDFKQALKEVEPSAMREVLVEVPRVNWTDVGGLEEVKMKLREAVEMPLKEPDAFKRMGIRPPRGILLYGPPGSGKTLLAKAVATESEANFISIKGPEVMSKWVGESEKAVRMIFKKAKQVAPCIVFLDELDAIAHVRGFDTDSGVSERVVNQLLTSMDGLETLEGVCVIGATNRPDRLDPAMLRTGRFDRILLVPTPNKDARLAILKVHTRTMPLEGVDLEELAVDLDSYSGADIEGLCREAAMIALREAKHAKKVMTAHFQEAMKVVRPSIDADTIKFYEEFDKKFKKGIDRGRREENILYR